MGTKTVNVEMMKNEVNEMLASSDCSKEQRIGMCCVLETLLHKTNNYCGFQYLYDRDLKECAVGSRPGINEVCMDDDDQTIYNLRFKNTDDSRRKYF